LITLNLSERINPMSNNNGDSEIDLIIGSSDKIRERQCFNAVQNILKQHDCQIIPVITIIGNKINTGYQVVAIPRK